MTIEPTTPSDGAVSAAPESPIAGAVEPGPANPAKSELGGWYDNVKNTESLVRGDISGEASQGEQPGDTPAIDHRSLISEPGFTARTYADYAVPAEMGDVKLDKTAIHQLNTLLDSKIKDHDGFQHQGLRDELLGRHIQEMSRLNRELQQHQIKAWNDTNAQWRDQTRAEFGNRLESELAGGKAVIQMFGGDAKQQQELMKFMDYTGSGNHAGMVRLLGNIARALNVFENFSVPANASTRGAPGGSAGKRGWYDRT